MWETSYLISFVVNVKKIACVVRDKQQLVCGKKASDRHKKETKSSIVKSLQYISMMRAECLEVLGKNLK